MQDSYIYIQDVFANILWESLIFRLKHVTLAIAVGSPPSFWNTSDRPGFPQLTSISTWRRSYIYNKVWVKSLIHSQNSTEQPLNFGDVSNQDYTSHHRLTITFLHVCYLWQWVIIGNNYSLTYWGRDKMAAISQTTFSTQGKSINFDYDFTQICSWWSKQIICQHWFRLWLGADRATSHYLNQWW